MAQGKYSDGKTINVVAPAGGAVAGQLYRINGWNGVCEVTAAAGETFALNIDPTFTFYIPMPAAVAAAQGDVLYMPPATGGVGATALTATAAGNVAAVKVHEAKDANNIVGVRILNNA
jgi:predicted RecA/RadA family phage recombinase